MKKNTKNMATFRKDTVKVTHGKTTMKFSRRKSGISVKAKSGDFSYTSLWKHGDVKSTTTEHSHSRGEDWTVVISNQSVPMATLGFGTRSDARDFSRNFKSKFDIA
jgi:hypothetical protein